MHASAESADGPRVLVVCTANQFRSPYAELLLAGRAAETGLNWSFASAGTTAKPGRQMDARIVELLGRAALPVPDEWRSRRVTGPLLEGVDIVLTMEQHHRRAVVEAWPPAVNRSFLFGQFAELIAAVGVDHPGADALLAAIRAHRGTVQPRPDQDYEIADPAGRSLRRLQDCTARIADVVDRMLPIDGAGGSAQRR